MSFIYRDFLGPARASWNSASALYQRFTKVWPTKYVDGIHVYDNRMDYWNGSLRSDKPFKRFLNSLGVQYATLEKQKYKGVTNVYFSITSDKYTYSSKAAQDIVDDLTSTFIVGQEFELYIHYAGDSKKILTQQFKLKPGHDPSLVKSYTIDTVQIRNELNSNPMKYFAGIADDPVGKDAKWHPARSTDYLAGKLKGAKTTDPLTRVEYDHAVTPIYATLALLDNGSMFQQQGTIYEERTTILNDNSTDVYYDYAYKIKYKVIALPTTTSYITTQIKLLGDKIAGSLSYNGTNVYIINHAVINTTLKEAVVAMNNISSLTLTYNGYLRVDAVTALGRLEFRTMLGKVFGTGYDKESSKWYEKVIAVILIIAAIVVTIVTGNPMLGALILSVGGALYAMAFPYATDMTKVIGKCAQIMGYIAAITGIYAAIKGAMEATIEREAAKVALKRGISQEAAKDIVMQLGTTELLKMTLINFLTTTAESMATSFTNMLNTLMNPETWFDGVGSSLKSITLNDVSGALKNLQHAFDMYMKFFGEKITGYNNAEQDQAVKETGIQSALMAVNMLDEVDALTRMSEMVENNFGGKKTQNFLTKIT